jgi:hypothetical protein
MSVKNDEVAVLAAEIAQMEAVIIEQQKQAEMTDSQAQQEQYSPPKQRRLVRKVRLVPKPRSSPSRKRNLPRKNVDVKRQQSKLGTNNQVLPTTSTTTTDLSIPTQRIQVQQQHDRVDVSIHNCSSQDEQALALQREIEAMQADILATQTTAAQQRQADEDLKRRELEEEIKQMELQIQKANVSKRGLKHHSQPSPSDALIVDRYKKMCAMGVPQQAVRHYMRKEGVSETMIAAVFSDSAVTTTPVLRKRSRASTTPASKPVQPNMISLLGSLSVAVADRDQRLQQTGGQLQFKEFEPEVAEVNKKPQNLGIQVAELVSQAARDREYRLEKGGQKKVTIIKEKEEYKKDFSDIVKDAAELGRLTRLKEVVLESVAAIKTPAQQWKSQGLMAIQWKSTHMTVIKQAAKAGSIAKLPEYIVSNVPEEEQDSENDKNKTVAERRRHLLELYAKAGEGQRKIDTLVLDRRELSKDEESLLIRPMDVYASVENVVLPRESTPKINVKKPTTSAMSDVSRVAATVAWERRSRLDRPKATPRIKEQCGCPYCVNPSPYQTHAYKLKADRRKKEMEADLEKQRLQRLQQKQRALDVVSDLSLAKVSTGPLKTPEMPQSQTTSQHKTPERALVTPSVGTKSAAELKREIEAMEAAIRRATMAANPVGIVPLTHASTTSSVSCVEATISKPVAVTKTTPQQRKDPKKKRGFFKRLFGRKIKS